jgi:hypothetical protein
VLTHFASRESNTARVDPIRWMGLLFLYITKAIRRSGVRPSNCPNAVLPACSEFPTPCRHARHLSGCGFGPWCSEGNRSVHIRTDGSANDGLLTTDRDLSFAMVAFPAPWRLCVNQKTDQRKGAKSATRLFFIGTGRRRTVRRPTPSSARRSPVPLAISSALPRRTQNPGRAHWARR